RRHHCPKRDRVWNWLVGEWQVNAELFPVTPNGPAFRIGPAATQVRCRASPALEVERLPQSVLPDSFQSLPISVVVDAIAREVRHRVHCVRIEGKVVVGFGSNHRSDLSLPRFVET